MTIAAAIVPAGGAGIRMGKSRPKQFLELAGQPILIHTLQALHNVPAISSIIVAAPAEHLELTRDLISRSNLDKIAHVVAGGATRQDSVRAGLALLPEEVEMVVVHDGVRPLVSGALVEKCLAVAGKTGAAIAAIPASDTLKSVNSENNIIGTVSREGLWQAQTPQVARAELLRKAFAIAAEQGFMGTDEAALLENIGVPVSVVAGSETNIKVTRPEDLALAAAAIQGKEPGGGTVAELRIGHGFDAHRLQEGRKLVLGGVSISHDRGLLGHSDADVVLHALSDAMLGGGGVGDIGRHFPDSDKAYKDISSLLILERVVEILASAGFRLANADITIVAQEPKLSPYFAEMTANIAARCGVEENRINLKATTTEEMGFAGRKEGIAAYAVVTLAVTG